MLWQNRERLFMAGQDRLIFRKSYQLNRPQLELVVLIKKIIIFCISLFHFPLT